jgi:hypothetical protein
MLIVFRDMDGSRKRDWESHGLAKMDLGYEDASRVGSLGDILWQF